MSLKEAWARRDWYNLASIRNLWAITSGSFVLAASLAGVALYLVGDTAGAFVLYIAWPTIAVLAAVYILAYGVPRCEACGHRLRAGYYTCPACSSTTPPRSPR